MAVALMAVCTYKTSNEVTSSQLVTSGLTLPGKVDMRRCIVRIMQRSFQVGLYFGC